MPVAVITEKQKKRLENWILLVIELEHNFTGFFVC